MSIGFVGFCLPIRVFVFFLTHTSTDARERPTGRPTVVQSRLVMRFQPSRSTLCHFISLVCPPNISSITIDRDELFELPGYPGYSARREADLVMASTG
jgi:hypothetical protein